MMRPTRRALLRQALGGAAALTFGLGCRDDSSRALVDALDLSGVDGEIVGASHALGHRLRDGGLPEPQTTREVPVVIAGAGVAGLCAGHRLSRRGFHDFEILELEDAPGGNSRSGVNEISAFPWGAHYLPVPGPETVHVRELLDEMGMIQDFRDGEPVWDPRHLCHAPQERFFEDGFWSDGVSARDLVAETRQVEDFESEMERLRPLFSLPRSLSVDNEEMRALDRLSMREFIDRRGWNSPRLRWYLEYCSKDDYGCSLETVSAWAAWHYFCSRPAEAPYLTWPEGNGRIVRHLVDRLAGTLRLGRLVYGIRRTGEYLEVDVLEAKTGRAERLRAQRVIFALPQFLAPRVLEGFDRDVSSFTYSPWLVANLTVERLPEGAAWDNVYAPSPSLGYVVATHQNLRSHAAGPSVLTWYLPLVGDPDVERRRLLDASWKEHAALILADLAAVHPEILQLVRRVDVMLWGHAMVRPTPGFLWSDPLHVAAQPWRGVHFAHSDLSGFSLFEEAQFHGIRAADETLAELST